MTPHLEHQLLTLLIILTSANFAFTVSIGSHDCTEFDVINGTFYCFQLNSDDLTFEEAKYECRKNGGSLPVITSSEVNDLLLPIAKTSRLTWLALVQRTRPWRWAHSHSEVGLQGCYIKNEKNFKDPVILQNMTQDICFTYCKGQRARYAALRLGRECYCSKEFHIIETESGNSYPCNVRCPGNDSQHCGSESKSVLVFSLYGTASHWGSDQPNEHLSYQSCALADADHSYWWNDVKCKERHGALCHHHAPFNLDLSIDDKFCEDRTHNTLLLNRTCFTFIPEKRTWFQALSKCAEIGAKLFELDGKFRGEMYDSLRHHMDRNFRNVNSRSQTKSFWIGLFKREWTWNPGNAERSLLFSNWELDSPSSEKQNCSAINEQGVWEDAECERKYPYVCQYDNLTAPIIRPRTTFPPIIKNSLRPLEADPVPAESFTFRKHGIWLILAGSILLVFIMIFITVAYCRHCHRVKEERKKFTLYYGIDVGSASGSDSNAGKKEKKEKKEKKSRKSKSPARLDPTAPPLTNGINGLPANGVVNEYSSEPTYAEYGYTGTIENTNPIKPSKKRNSKYRQSEQ